MVDSAAGPSSDASEAVLANSGDGTATEQLNADFRCMVSHDTANSGGLSPLKRAGNDAESPASSWRSQVPGDSPGTARHSRRHRSQPFFIGVAGECPFQRHSQPLQTGIMC